MLRADKSQMNTVFKHFLLVVLVWCFGASMMRLGVQPSPLFWNRILTTGFILAPFVFYHFSLVYINPCVLFRKLFSLYLVAIILLVGNYAGLVIADVNMNAGQLHYELGPLAPVLALFGVGYAVAASINIYKKGKQQSDGRKNINQLVFFGASIYTFTSFLNFFPIIGSYPVDLVGTLIFAVLITYSIFKHKFLNSVLRLRSLLIHFILTIVLTMVVILLVNFLGKLTPHLHAYTIAIVTGLVAIIGYHSLKMVVTKLIDNLFYKNWFLKTETLKNFNQVINSTIDLKELAESIVVTISAGIGVKQVAIFLTNEEGTFQLFCAQGHDKKVTIDFRFGPDSALVKLLQSNETLSIEDFEKELLFKRLWETEKDQIKMLQAQLFVPIHLMNKLIGFIVLSHKEEEVPFSKSERDILLTMASSTALAIQNAKLYLAAKTQAITDSLTGINNHRFFHDSLSEEFNNAQQTNTTLSLILFDVDMFKFFNDLYGHSAGDLALKELALITKEVIPPAAIFCRYGGEEFGILLPGVNLEDAYCLAEKCRTNVHEKMGKTNKFLTISLGVATFPNNASSKEELLNFADKALYCAKTTGRNNTVIFSKQDSDRDENVKEAIQASYFSTVYALTATIDAKDSYTHGHSQNVAKLAVKLGQRLGLSKEKLDMLRYSGLLHDIGKIGIPENILTKPSKLTDDEMAIMKSHVDISASIIKYAPNLIKTIPSVICHHERYDGLGYPRGLKGEAIPLEGRILAIADSFDAMMTDRPYRKGLGLDEAINELKRGAGTQFDPKLVSVFCQLVVEDK